MLCRGYHENLIQRPGPDVHHLPKTLMVPSFITEYSVKRSSVRRRNAVKLISFSGSSVNSCAICQQLRGISALGDHVRRNATAHGFASVQSLFLVKGLYPRLVASVALVRSARSRSGWCRTLWRAPSGTLHNAGCYVPETALLVVSVCNSTPRLVGRFTFGEVTRRDLLGAV